MHISTPRRQIATDACEAVATQSEVAERAQFDRHPHLEILHGPTERNKYTKSNSSLLMYPALNVRPTRGTPPHGVSPVV